MKKFVIQLLIFTLLAPVGPGWVLGSAISHAADIYPFYFVTGNIADNDNVGIAGRNVVLYKSESFLAQGQYVQDKTGSSTYFMNVFGVLPPLEPFVSVGQTYNVYIINDRPDNPPLGYGADPVSITLSGSGMDIADLELKKGAGAIFPPGIGGAPPVFEWIKFGNRLYQKALVEKGMDFIVSANPKIGAKVNSISALDMDSIKIKINAEGGATAVKDIKINEANFTNKEFSTKGIEAKTLTALTFAYDVPDANKLGDGTNTVTFYATDIYGKGTVEVATVKVLIGPVKVIGPVLTYPSPFSPTRDKQVTIQYTLSADSDVDIFLFSPVGETVMRFNLSSGQNGGAAGVNKITWDGTKPSGRIAGNGAYSGAIVAKDEGRIIAKFKFAIVD